MHALAHGAHLCLHPHAPRAQVTARCACGRRVMHLAQREGEAVPTLKCTAECTAAARRAALADAFGVEDPDTHVPYCDRHRAVTYSVALLQVRVRMCVVCVRTSACTPLTTPRAPPYHPPHPTPLSPPPPQAATSRPDVWGALEQEVARFVGDASQRRHALHPMPSAQRALAHELAEAYGLATVSMG